MGVELKVTVTMIPVLMVESMEQPLKFQHHRHRLQTCDDQLAAMR